jgi:hypothetical protein
LKVRKVDPQVYQSFAMSQVFEEVVEVMVLGVTKDECCQAIGYRGSGSSEIRGVAHKTQSPEGREITLKE